MGWENSIDRSQAPKAQPNRQAGWMPSLRDASKAPQRDPDVTWRELEQSMVETKGFEPSTS